MTMGGWIVFVALAAFTIIFSVIIANSMHENVWRVLTISCGILICLIMLGALLWYFSNYR